MVNETIKEILRICADEYGLELSIPSDREIILKNSAKTLVVEAVATEGQAFVIKILQDTQKNLVLKFNNEVSLYEMFAEVSEGMPVPRLMVASTTPPFMVLEKIGGTVLSHERFPHQTSRKEIQLVINSLDRLTLCRGRPGHREEIVARYRDSFIHYVKRGYLQNQDLVLLDRLAEIKGWVPQLNHGDPIPQNILLHNKSVFLVDWEFGGLYVPHYDLAVLWVSMVRQPEIQCLIEHHLQSLGTLSEICFGLNLLRISSRELRLHHELAQSVNAAAELVPLIERLIESARNFIRRSDYETLI